MRFPRRGEIYLVIIQNDVSNEHSPITIVAAVSSQFRTHRTHPRAKTGLSKPSAVIVSQLRSIDRARLQQRLGVLDSATMRRVDEAIKISLGLVPL
jgi:mRNA interferase MazF